MKYFASYTRKEFVGHLAFCQKLLSKILLFKPYIRSTKMPKQRTTYLKKRKFSGNQYSKQKRQKVTSEGTSTTSSGEMTQSESTASMSDTSLSASARKINLNNHKEMPELSENEVSGYRIINLEILEAIFKLLPCKKCFECQLMLVEDDCKRMGSASCLSVCCSVCGWSETFFTSEKVGHCFEINRRMTYAMRLIGCGLSSMERFCSTMNIPPPVNPRAFAYHNKAILRAVKDVAEATMHDAAQEIHDTNGAEADETGNIKTAVSCDGTWQRRGFSSLHGCVAVLSMDTGKVLDIEPMSKVCNRCKKNDGKDEKEKELWKVEHAPTCKANYKGSAPAMETEGAKRIFNRSVSSHKLQYDKLFGDGDSKSFSAVENTYKEEYGVLVSKKECVGHVQKRLGTALRKLKKEKKGLGGKGKLTDAMIDKMQNYYGIAIRSNKGDLEAMKSNVLATLFHCASNDNRPLHTYCPDGEDSWCGFKKDKAKKTKSYKHGKGLPLEVISEVKPIYARLSDDDLLGKCLDGKTQNQNESFNGMIWQRIPKTVFVGSDSFKLGVYDAVAHFNIGELATIKVLENLNMKPGVLSHVGVHQADCLRIKKANYREKESTKMRRKVLRGQRKTVGDKNKQKEGETYAAGSF